MRLSNWLCSVSFILIAGSYASAQVPTLVQHASGSSTLGQQLTSYTLPLANQSLPGNALILAVCWGDTSSTVTVSDNRGNVWTAGPVTHDPANMQSARLFFVLNAAAGTQSITAHFSGAPTFISAVASEFYNVAGAGAMDGGSGNFASSGATSYSAGSFTAASPGDLIWHYAMCDHVCGTNTYTPGTGFTLLSADNQDHGIVQYEVQPAAGTANPKISSANATGFVSVAIALKAATQGTQARSGILARSVEHINTQNETASSVTYQFPSAGNLIVVVFVTGGNGARKIQSISDTNGNTWLQAGTGIANDSEAQIFYAANARTSQTLKLTINLAGTNSAGYGDTFMTYDVTGAAASPFDTSAAVAGNNSSGNITGVSITPSTANGLVLTAIGVAADTVVSVTSSPSGALFSATIAGGETVPAHDDENNGWAGYYNSTTNQVTFTWTHDVSQLAGTLAWASIAAAFKADLAGPPDTTPPSAPANLMATAISGTQINLSWTASTDNVGVTGYTVERCLGAGCSAFVQIAAQRGTTFSDTGLVPSTSYSYVVSARDAAGNVSASSNVASATTQASSVPAGIKLVQYNGEDAGITASSSLPFSSANTAGNLIAVAIRGGTSGQVFTVTDSRGNIYQQAVSINQTTDHTLAIFYSQNVAGGSNTVSVSESIAGQTLRFSIMEYSGVATSNALDVTAGQQGASVSPRTVTTATSASDELLLGFISTADPQTFTAGNGYTIRGFVPAEPNTKLIAEDRIQPAAGVASATATISSADNWAAVMATFKPVVSGGGSGSITVAISPGRGGVTTGQTLGLTANVTNDLASAGVTWTATVGTLTGQTPTNATFSSTVAGSFLVTATSKADGTKSASMTIGVTDLAGVLTYRNSLSRDGANTREFALTPSNVTTATFGKLFSCPVDGEVYAQPLWVANLAIGGGTHNTVFVATENDSVYAFDADVSPCHQYWRKSFLSPGVTPVPPSDTGETGDINKKIGITSTPVIDPTSKTLYVLAKTKEGTGNYHQRLHALSLVDGSEKFDGPVDITAAITVPGSGDTGDTSAGCSSTPGNVPFCPLREGQRPGLALANGNVYVAWASHGDVQPYHGWIMSFNAATLALTHVFNDSPNGREGGIWMSGGAPAFDSAGYLFAITGNGDFNSASNDFGDSFLKLNSTLSLLDWFTPFNEGTLDAMDQDLGSGGAVVLVDLAAPAPHQHLLIGGGKGAGLNGELYVLDRDNLGHFNSGGDQVVQEFALGNEIFSTGAFWQSTLYVAAVNQPLRAFALNTSTSQFNTAATSQSSATFGFPGATPSVSASGTTNGIVWALNTNANGTPNGGGSGPAILRAFDATNLGTELWNSTQGSGNAAGNAVKFCVPTVGNGKVYIGTQTELTVYGLLP